MPVLHLFFKKFFGYWFLYLTIILRVIWNVHKIFQKLSYFRFKLLQFYSIIKLLKSASRIRDTKTTSFNSKGAVFRRPRPRHNYLIRGKTKGRTLENLKYFVVRVNENPSRAPRNSLIVNSWIIISFRSFILKKYNFKCENLDSGQSYMSDSFTADE